MILYLFRNPKMVEPTEFDKILKFYKVDNKKAYIYTVFEYGMYDNFVNAIIKKAEPSKEFADSVKTHFWQFDKFSKEKFWTKRAEIAYRDEPNRFIPIKFLVNGVVVIDEEDDKKRQLGDYIIKVVDNYGKPN